MRNFYYCLANAHSEAAENAFEMTVWLTDTLICSAGDADIQKYFIFFLLFKNDRQWGFFSFSF